MLGLNYVSWADNTGYAIAAKAYLRGLADAGVPLRWTPMTPGRRGYRVTDSPPTRDPRLRALCRASPATDVILIHTVPEYYPPWIHRARAEGQRIFGYTVWEFDRLPDHWPAILNQLDGLVVPCRWNADVFRRSGVTVPIHVVPHASQMSAGPVSPDDVVALDTRLGGATARAGRFVFYTIGAWSERKAPRLVLDAYRRAFTPRDPVLLVVKTGRRDMTRRARHWRDGFRWRCPQLRDGLRATLAATDAAPVRLIDDETLAPGGIEALHAVGDCFVSLSRSEGWGLGAFEAALSGNPVIMTGYGGQRDFLDPDRSVLIDYTLVDADEPEWAVGYARSGQWAEPDLDQAVVAMRAMVADPAPARDRAAAQAAALRVRFAPDAVTRTLLEALR